MLTPTNEALTVALVSSVPSELSVPATVTIPAGQTAVTFDVAAVDETVTDGVQNVTVSTTEVAAAFSVQQGLTFGAGGRIRADMRNDVAPGQPDLAVQPDGKLVVAGRNVDIDNAWNVLRYNADGTPDTTFGTAGKVTSTHSTVSSVTTERVRLLPDGRIVVLGNAGSNSVIIRYTANGSLDRSLDGDGILTVIPEQSRAVDFTVDPDGAMYLVGKSATTEISVRKFTSAGTEVYSANATVPGTSSQTSEGIERQPDEKLLVYGSANPVTGNDLLTVIRF